jgi:hypothetical protein
MEPISIALALLMKNPNLASTAATAAQSARAPAPIDVSKMQASFADLSRGVLKCYHKTAHYELSDVIQQPWPRQAQYAAENSAVVRIRYTGISTTRYEMVVAIMVQKDKVRTSVINDSAIVPYNKKCQLEEWSGA